MANTAYTPGPWHVVIDDDGNPLSGRPSIQASDELDCAIVHWDGFIQDYWRSARGDKEIHANARLIAAAPDLLEACRTMIAWDDAEKQGPDYGTQTRDTHPDGELIWKRWWDDQQRLCERAFDTARAAIARATGEKE